VATVQTEVFRALRSIDISEDNAMAAAEALARRDEVLPDIEADVGALKADVSVLKADVSTLKIDVSALKMDVSMLKADVTTLKADTTKLKVDAAVLKWMMGFILAFQLAQLFMMFRLLEH